MKPRGGRGAPNTLRDQAIPNVLEPEVHAAPPHEGDEDDDDRAAAVEQRDRSAAMTRGDVTGTDEVAAHLYEMAGRFAIRSERVEIRLLRGFQAEAAPLAQRYGDLIIRDADDERVSLLPDGSFSGAVVPEDAPKSWRPLESAIDMIAFYDPGDLFADLADRLTARHPNVASPGIEDAGPRLRQLAEMFAKRSASARGDVEAAAVDLIEEFEEAAAPLAMEFGGITVLDGDDERLTLERDGQFVAEVIPEDDEASWRTLRTSQELTEFYGPEELFRALAEKLAITFPAAVDTGPEVAAGALHDLAVMWREQSLDAEARLFAEFNRAAGRLGRTLGEFVIVDDDDEQLIIGAESHLSARILDRSTGAWRQLDRPDELIETYDPADVFNDLADALAEAFPALAMQTPVDERSNQTVSEDEGAPGLWYPGAWPSALLPGLVDVPAGPSQVPRPIPKTAHELAASAKRDARIGGWILAVFGITLLGLGLWSIATAPDVRATPGYAEIGALRALFGWIFLVVAVVLIVLGVSATGGDRGPRQVAGVVDVGLAGLILLGGFPSALVAAPLFLSAYFLLRSSQVPLR